MRTAVLTGKTPDGMPPEETRALGILVDADRGIRALFTKDDEAKTITIRSIVAHDGTVHELVEPIFVANVVPDE